ncbi:hypothetical protein H5410_052279 [Solanum commersonii]|uniref:Uncharacterized protein n=1 Tax=Solanum commersonii TaxID=4109 RepID=A0A9J5X2X9_SOLCO|nr:hypothetical protein H5410_052279 [Solanum commersonii]
MKSHKSRRTLCKKSKKYAEAITGLLGWIDYKRKDKKDDSKGNDQMSNDCYSTPLSDPGPILDNLDASAWDAAINILIFGITFQN